MKKFEVPIEVSARHIHLSEDDQKKLFGNKIELGVKNNVSQPGQFAANETVKIIGPKGNLNVRIVGPQRTQTQLEISVTDSYILGIEVPPVRVSGDLKNTPGGLTIKGPIGQIKLQSGIIVAQRHLHIEPQKAIEFNIKNGDLVNIQVDSSRSIIYKNVIVRSKDNVDNLSFQVDTDEANAGYIKTGDKGCII